MMNNGLKITYAVEEDAERGYRTVARLRDGRILWAGQWNTPHRHQAEAMCAQWNAEERKAEDLP